MKTKLHKTLEAVWYAAGPAQYLMYGIWVIVISGLFNLDGNYQLIPTFWKFLGFAIFVATIWGTLRQKMMLILCSTMTAIVVGAVFATKAVMFGDADIMRAATQSHYFSLVIIITWGFYLSNLCSRQMLEFKRAGIDE
jgi:hypothetical protein